MNFRIGDKVRIVAATEWCAAIDGFKGAVTGFEQGMVCVTGLDPDDGVEKLFYVPADELTLALS